MKSNYFWNYVPLLLQILAALAISIIVWRRG